MVKRRKRPHIGFMDSGKPATANAKQQQPPATNQPSPQKSPSNHEHSLRAPLPFSFAPRYYLHRRPCHSFHTCPYIDRDSLSCDLLQRKSTIFTRPHTRNFFVLEATDETDQAPRHPPLAPSILSHFATCMFLPTASFCFPPLSPILTAILQRRRERENTLIFCFELSRNFLTRFLTV